MKWYTFANKKKTFKYVVPGVYYDTESAVCFGIWNIYDIFYAFGLPYNEVIALFQTCQCLNSHKTSKIKCSFAMVRPD